MVNDYDKYAAHRQAELLKGESKPHRFSEKPMMKKMLPDLTGKKVLLLGCGTGEESTLLKDFNARDITGIDISKVSIEIAKQTYPDVEFIVADMHELPFSDNTFDFVYSSLAIHYSNKPLSVYQEIHRVLKNGGRMLFSLCHPLRWSSEQINYEGIDYKIMGYAYPSTENRVFGNYHTFTKHDHKFPDGEILSMYVGSPSMHFKLLKQAGFDVDDFSESICTDEAKDYDYNYWLKNKEIPQFMAYLVTKKD